MFMAHSSVCTAAGHEAHGLSVTLKWCGAAAAVRSPL